MMAFIPEEKGMDTKTLGTLGAQQEWNDSQAYQSPVNTKLLHMKQ